MRNALSLPELEPEYASPREAAAPVLLALAEPTLRRVLATVFAAGGYDVTCAANGREAAEVLQRERFPLVVAELELPCGDGLHVAACAAAQEFHAECILLAEPRSVAAILEACDSGLFYNHFWKPLHDAGDLVRCAGRALERRQLRLSQATLLTELRDAKAEVRAFCSRLEQLDKVTALGQMTESVAHSLDTPLMNLRAYAQYLNARLERRDSEALTPEQMDRVGDYMKEMERGMRRCQQVVSNVLDYTRIHEEKPGPVRLPDAIENALELLREGLDATNVQVRMDALPELPPVLANPNRLQQAVVNLIRNAQQALGKAGGVISITAEVAEALNAVTLRIEDNGPGIAPDVMPRLFEPFFSTRSRQESVGLGLTIARSIVREWNGELSVTSSPGHGATATLILPLCAEVVLPHQNRDLLLNEDWNREAVRRVA